MRSFAIARALLARPAASFTTRAAIPSTIRFSSTTPSPSAPETTITRNTSPVTPNAASSRRYAVGLSSSNNYPIYAVSKAAGQSKFTIIKRVEGDKQAFIQDLVEATGIPREEIVLQPVTGHIQFKGTRTQELKKYLTETFGEPPKLKATTTHTSA
ncbi:hypothetical protein B0T11DRAFT_279630 [Plectosphaerella cucumerina]|uniref:Large ribosomal subunit protein mL49 n=1 Tax=Plectosphaerella cucumerina TaxID=40658 RepID=A0A8K0TDE6_9PEZI|nr:hypothetical protein B0T11DRAFT_279630 [Plectosphaerella cucumerina]